MLEEETCDLLQQDCADLKPILILYELCMFQYYHSRDQSYYRLTYFISFEVQDSSYTGTAHPRAF